MTNRCQIVERLVRVGFAGGAPLLAIVALWASLGWARAPQAEHVLLSGSASDRRQAARELCELGAWQSLRAGLLDADEVVRHLTVACWEAEYGDSELLLAMVEDPSASVRTALAMRLSEAARVGEVDLAGLIALLQDPRAAVRSAAAEGIPLDDDATALALLVPLLDDAAPEVAATAAQRLARRGLEAGLEGEQRAAYERAAALARLAQEAPETAGALVGLQRRVARFDGFLGTADEGALACAQNSRQALNGLSQRVEAVLSEVAAGPKAPDRFEALLHLEGDLAAIQQGYALCLGATPLDFDAPGPGLFESHSVLLLAEVGSAWETQFGLLRSDLPAAAEGGELWLQSTFGVDAAFPRRQVARDRPRPGPELDLSGRLERHQLFKNEELSGWGGGLWWRGELPWGCAVDRHCRLGASMLGRRSPGLEGEAPRQLVAAHRHFRADASLAFPIDGATTSLTAEVSRVRYEERRLAAAGLDVLGARLEVDTSVQFRLMASRHRYAQQGPSDDGGTPLERVDRDSTLLGGQLGVRFGDADEGLELLMLGGLSFAMVEDLAADVGPQVTFTALLERRSGSVGGDLSRLRLGGRRVVEASPRDFALQTVSESFLDYTFQGLALPQSGVRFDARIAHQVTSYDGPLTVELPELDIHVLEGHLGVRFVVATWVGVELANTLRAIRFRDGDFQVANRFLLSLFVPIGEEALGAEETLPW